MNPDETTAGLVAWLRARLDEREQAANDAIDEADIHWPPPTQVLAEVATHRRILDAYISTARDAARDATLSTDAGLPVAAALQTGRLLAYDDTVRWLGAGYADHPDYQQEWRP
jgi:hypothetical protein